MGGAGVAPSSCRPLAHVEAWHVAAKHIQSGTTAGQMCP